MAGTTSSPRSGGHHTGPPVEPLLQHPVQGSVPEPWGGEVGVLLRPVHELEATTVQHVIEQDVDVNRDPVEVMDVAPEAAPGSEVFQQTLQELHAKTPLVLTTSSDETMPSVPERQTTIRRKKSISSRRLSRPNVQGSSTPTSSSSNNTTSCPSAPVVVRSQHALSHARTNRLSARSNPPSKADAAIHRRQLRTIEMNRLKRLHNRAAQNPDVMATAIHSETHLLDGDPGWSRKELPENDSSRTGFVITPSSYNSLWDEEPRIAPPISWKTLNEARQKCTEWLVQHVLLPDPIPTPVRSRPRTRSSIQL